MFVLAVNLYVKPECISEFIAATIDNASNTRKEPGNLRFDVSRSQDDPTRFMFYEVYKSADDLAKHQQTAHYFRWREAVATFMAQPRQGLKFNSIFPGDDAW